MSRRKGVSKKERIKQTAYPHVISDHTQQFTLANFKRGSSKISESIPSQIKPTIAPEVRTLTDRPPKIPDFDHPLRQLPEGDYGLDDVSFTNYFPPETVLPGSDDFKARKDRCAKGYRVKPYSVPLRFGGISNLLVNGTEWADKVNTHISSISDALPKAPFVLVIIGTIGSGKTALISQLVNLYAHQDAFSTIRLVSPTAHMDPLMMTLKAKRNPQVKFITDSQPDDAFFASLGQNVERMYGPYANLAEKGLYHRKLDPSIELLKESNKEFHSFDHPYLNSLGEPHGEKLRLFFPPTDRLLPTQTMYGSNFSPDTMRLRKMMQLKIGNSVKNAETKFQSDLSKPINLDKESMTEFIGHMNASNPHQQALNQQLLFERNLLSNKIEASKAQYESKPTLMVYDDCAYHFKNAGRFTQLMTIIRHAQASAMFIAQKVTAIPTMLRNLATAVIIFKIPNARELKIVEDEWGGVLPDFLGAYHAATSDVNGRDRDFLYIDMIKKTASRSMIGELVPTDEGNTADDS